MELLAYTYHMLQVFKSMSTYDTQRRASGLQSDACLEPALLQEEPYIGTDT